MLQRAFRTSMKSSLLALALFFFLFAFVAKPSLAARHDPSLLHTDGKELRSDTNHYIVSALRGAVEDGLNLVLSAFDCPYKKSSWPELVGENGEAAAVIIEKENPCVYAIIIPDGMPVTLDYRSYRVRVFVSEEGKVDKVPVIG